MLKSKHVVLVVGLLALPVVALAGARSQWQPEPDITSAQISVAESQTPVRQTAPSSESPAVVRARLAKLYGQ
jgi:hypothetical protein